MYATDNVTESKTIQRIYLEDNAIGDEGAQFLAEALRNKTTLASLQLTNNQIGAKGAQYLSSILQNNVRLTKLDLRDNNIGDQGALCIANALQDNMTLTKMNLSFNRITATAADQLYVLFQNKTELVLFDLKGNDGCDNAAIAASFQIRNNMVTFIYSISFANLYSYFGYRKSWN
ncbi:unnamed protein product [Adineta steineri]|uniref:Uncharacterized protein n=1 Tax=Adineta steineri TaxID=433720 RepID=A0A815FYA6_9BILA|nr:unnamed protein product [Adineta steineri]